MQILFVVPATQQRILLHLYLLNDKYLICGNNTTTDVFVIKKAHLIQFNIFFLQDNTQENPPQTNQIEILNKKPYIGRKLGAGTYGTVYNSKLNNKPVAAKIANVTTKLDASILHEIAILRKCTHKNVIDILAIGLFGRHLFFEMPIASYTLDDIFYTKLTKAEKISYSQQLITGVKYLHSQNIIHRDLKPNNLLIFNPDGNIHEFEPSKRKVGMLKITDFGFSIALSCVQGVKKSSNVMTLGYKAPEIDLLNDYNENSDKWSVGIILQQIYLSDDHKKIFEYSEEEEFLEQLANLLSLDEKEFIRKYKQMDPEIINNFRTNLAQTAIMQTILTQHGVAIRDQILNLLSLNPNERILPNESNKCYDNLQMADFSSKNSVASDIKLWLYEIKMENKYSTRCYLLACLYLSQIQNQITKKEALACLYIAVQYGSDIKYFNVADCKKVQCSEIELVVIAQQIFINSLQGNLLISTSYDFLVLFHQGAKIPAAQLHALHLFAINNFSLSQETIAKIIYTNMYDLSIFEIFNIF